jgi:hypothetical protein
MPVRKRKSKKEQLRITGKGIIDIMKYGKPQGRVDGSIGTKPTVPCADVLESVVMEEVEEWLGARRIMYDRNNTGMGDIAGDGRKFRYGIKDAGDIIGCLPSGIHFELELKRGKGGSLSLGQQKRERKVNRNNGVYLIIHSANELEILLGPYL